MSLTWDDTRVRAWLAQMPAPADLCAAVAPHTMPALVHLAAGQRPTASIRGPDWRSIPVDAHTVHWCVPTGQWQIYLPGPGIKLGSAPIAQIGILPLWMLLTGQTAREATDAILALSHQTAA